MKKNRQEDLSEQADQKFARQLKEIISQYLAGDLTEDHLQALIEHHDPFGEAEYPDLGFAEMVLGKNKVISSFEATKAWWQGEKEEFWPGLEVLENKVKIRHSKATLRKAAKENKNGNADWRLIYIKGLSLREQYEIKSRSFRPHVTWWLEPKHDEWGKFKPMAGYYLINLRGQFGKMKYEDQEKEVSKLGRKYRSCQGAVFTEAINTIFMINKESIAQNWGHRGGLIGDSEQVIVYNGETGIGIHSVNISKAEPGMRIVVDREWDF